MQLSPDAFAYLFIIIMWIGIGFIFLKLVTKASKHLFSFVLLYGLAFSGATWRVFDLIMQGTNPMVALKESGIIYFGLIIPTAALDKLIPTELGPIAVVLLFIWWLSLVTTFAKREHFFISDIIDSLGRYRIFGAMLVGTLLWLAFGLGLPNFCAWLTTILKFPFNPFTLFLSFFIGGICIAAAEVALRLRMGESLGFLNILGLAKGVKKAVKSQ